MKKTIAMFTGLVFLLVLLLSGCAESIKTPDQDKLMADIFNSIESENYDTAKKLMTGLISESDLDQALPSIAEYIHGNIKEYKKIGYYFHTSVSNSDKINSQTLTYNVKTDYDDYNVEMVLLQKNGGAWNIYGYNVIRASEANVTGSLLDLSNFDFLQLFLLIFSAGSLALIIIAIVKCAKSPIRRKALWIVLIILLQIGFSVAQSASRSEFRIMLFLGMSSLFKYSDGSYALSVIVPLGAILFLCLRKRLIYSAEVYRLKKDALNVPHISGTGPQQYPGSSETTDMNPQVQDSSAPSVNDSTDKQ